MSRELPQPDELAYTGDIVVKSVPYGKSKPNKATGVAKVKKAVAALLAEADKRVTLDSIDTSSDISFENQVIINKEIAAILRKQALMLTTFVKNN